MERGIGKGIRRIYAKHRYINWKKHDYQSQKCEVIVSLALVPSRLSTMKSLILSLLTQSHKPDWIEVNIAKTDMQGKPNHWIVPSWLEELKSVRLV